jgi:hypothetical protein
MKSTQHTLLIFPKHNTIQVGAGRAGEGAGGDQVHGPPRSQHAVRGGGGGGRTGRERDELRGAVGILDRERDAREGI